MAAIKKTITIGTAADTAAVEKLNQTLRQLFKTAEGSQDEIAKSAAELKGNFTAMQNQLKMAEQQLRANGVTGKEFAQATLQVRAAMSDAKTGVDAFAISAKTQGTTVRELQSVYRATKDELGHFRTALDQVNTASQGAEAKQESMLGTLTRVAGGVAILYKSWQLLKDTVSEGLTFDKDLSQVAMSIQEHKGGFGGARAFLSDLSFGASKGTIFNADETINAIEKFRDSGFDVAQMTKENLSPILLAATATMQDLGDVADTVAESMDQFNLPLSETERMANAVTVAFRETGLTAQEMQVALRDAGSTAKASGTAYEDYIAVLARLKALGVSGDRPATFQRRFFSAINAPKASELATLARRGVNIYQTPESFDAGIGAADTIGRFGGQVPGSLGRAASTVGSEIGSTLRNMQENARATQEMQQQLVDLDREQAHASAEMRSYGALAKAAAGDVDDLKDQQGAFRDQLEETTAALQATKAHLGDVRNEIQQLANPRISGMDAFDDEVARLEMAAKREELQLLRSAEAGAKFGDSLKHSAGTASELKTRLQELKSAELVGERAYNDRAFQIQQQMKRFELEKLKLAPHQLFEQNALSRRIAGLQREFSIVNLEKDLAFDPARRGIDDALKAGGTPMNVQDAIAEAQRLGPQLAAAQEREAGGKQRVDALRRAAQAKGLERDVTYGDDLLAIKKAQRAAAEAAGITAPEQSAAAILGRLPGLGAEGRLFAARVGELESAQDDQKAVVRGYDDAIKDASETMDAYKEKQDNATESSEFLKDSISKLELRFEGMEKPLKSQIAILNEMASSNWTVADSFDFMGQRAGSMLVSLLGPNNERIKDLNDLKKAFDDMNAAEDGASNVLGTPWGRAQVIQAEAQNVQIKAGEVTVNAANGFIDKIKGADWGSSGWKLAAQGADLWARETFDFNHFARGGVVPGIGYRDTVPAMLTPGEEVLRRDDPRHRANGGGTTIVNIHNPVIRSEHDLHAIQERVSRALANELRRVRTGLPA